MKNSPFGCTFDIEIATYGNIWYLAGSRSDAGGAGATFD
ncbi:hypothetical protein SB48_HM08orf05833 [Heyndrickxia coagulans]|uniref:Uncharacterized protein n=1 Tax=Heyndrickxia coagulans TaxID=1398 RepID=A0AAN0WDA9_HEYCO|nr:hypothetical protein SB48_HM08orf05833 [Heyndrickxia coagulans]